MPTDARQAALTATNEAITALDFEPLETTDADELIAEAREILFEARAVLGAKLWPMRHAAWADAANFDAWHAARAAEQKADGRL